MDVSRIFGVFPPKMDGENDGTPFFRWMIWEYPYFWKHPYFLGVEIH